MLKKTTKKTNLIYLNISLTFSLSETGVISPKPRNQLNNLNLCINYFKIKILTIYIFLI